MASERVAAILRSKGAPFTPEEIESMPDSAGWTWIYTDRPGKPKDTREQICFTGFDPIDKERLQELADRMGLRVVTGVTKSLSLLCVGPALGPAKLAKAREQGVQLITMEELMDLAEAQFEEDESEVDVASEGGEEEGGRRSRPRQVFDYEAWEPGTWKFPLLRAFKDALDVRYRVRKLTKNVDGEKRTVYVQEWAQGVPPLYSFKVGDTIGPPFPRHPGDVALQVQGGTPDTWDAETGTVREGALVIQVYRGTGTSGAGWRVAEKLFMSQRQLVETLQTGLIPSQ